MTGYEVLSALVGLFMENIGVHYVKVAEIYKNNLLAFDVVRIIESEANFYVNIFVSPAATLRLYGVSVAQPAGGGKII